MSKRVFLFLVLNCLIVSSVGVLIQFLGIRNYLGHQGINYQQLLFWCFLWGMGGSFISLLFSRSFAKRAMAVEVIPGNTNDPELMALLDVIRELSNKAGLKKMPEVGIYPSDEINAFATGPSRNRALLAISSGLAHRMNRDQIIGVLGHEISHIANGDMVTLALLQGTVNCFVLFLARIISFGLIEDNGSRIKALARMFLMFGLEIFFNFFGSMLLAWFSRYREFRADAGSASLAGADKMINALNSLRIQSEFTNNSVELPKYSNMQVYGKERRFFNPFATHPSIEKRITALEHFQPISQEGNQDE